MKRFFLNTIFYILVFLVFSLPAMAHEIEKENIVAKHIASREKYDACLRKAGQKSLAQKACRKAYAKQRFFTVSSLYHLHTEHAFEAEELYSELLIGLKGRVRRVGKTMLGVPEIVMSLDSYGLSGVRIEFSSKLLPRLEALQMGEEIRIMGICKGMQGEDYVRVVHGEFMDQSRKYCLCKQILS